MSENRKWTPENRKSMIQFDMLNTSKQTLFIVLLLDFGRLVLG